MDIEIRKEIFRKTASTAIENSHAAIKQVWVVLFAGGTFALINSFDIFMGCAGFFLKDFSKETKIGLCRGFLREENLIHQSNIFILVALYVIYVLTLYRFYVGNIRVFDMRYIEIGKFIGLLSDKLPAEKRDELYTQFYDHIDTTGSHIWDSIFLMIKTFVIISLTIEMNSPITFMTIYLILMFLDVIWMLMSGRPNPYFRELFIDQLGLNKVIDKGLHRQLEMSFPSRALQFWMWNNLVCFCILCVVVVQAYDLTGYRPLDERWFFVAAAVTMLANCGADLGFTWLFYNPRFSKTHKLLVLKGNSQETNGIS